jgi:phospholipid/cholesterol/gamma-HCH transport system permease protein
MQIAINVASPLLPRFTVGVVSREIILLEFSSTIMCLILSGKVGSNIASEIGTMRVTEQIDALTVLGANPVAHLVVPRFLACVLLIPALTLFADGIGVLTGWVFSTQVLHVDSYYYWHYSRSFVTGFDVFQGIIKSVLFGGAIAIISCHRGFHSGAGAEGVGRAATEAFVFSFVTILVIDFLLGTFLMEAYFLIYPRTYSMG